MILGVTLVLFLLAAPFVWRRGPEGTGVAFGLAAAVAIVTATGTVATALIGFGSVWRVEAAFCGLVLCMALIALGIARAG